MFKDVMLELTYRCNLRCDFCYLLRRGLLNKKLDELGTAEVFKLIARFPAGTRFYLSGGEPLLRKDIFEIMERIKAAGSRFGLNTNGTLLTGPRVRALAALLPDYVIFSLHGDAKTHDRLTGLPGACRSLLASMKAFAAAAGPDTEVIVNCVVNRGNAGALAEAYRLACRAGADRVVFEHLQFLRPREAAALPARLKAGGVLTPVLESYGADAALVKAQFRAIRVSGGPAHFEVRPLMTEKDLDLYYNGEITPEGGCPKIFCSLNVEPDGAARLCVLYGLKAGSALKTPLAELLAFKKAHIGARLPSGCARCCHRFKLFRYC